MGLNFSTPSQRQPQSQPDMAKKVSPLADDFYFELNKENIENCEDLAPLDAISDDEDDSVYHTTLNPTGILEQRNPVRIDITFGHSPKQDMLLEEELELSSRNDLSELTVISLGSNMIPPPVEPLNFESPCTSGGKPMTAYGSPVSVNDACVYSGTYSADSTACVTNDNNTAQFHDSNLAPSPARPAAAVELVFGLNSPQSPHIALDSNVDKVGTERQHPTTSPVDVCPQCREVSKDATNESEEQPQQIENNTVSQVPEHGGDTVQASVKRMISARLHETHAALDEVLCDAVQAFEKANKEADRVLAAVSTAKTSAREVTEVVKDSKVEQLTQEHFSTNITSPPSGMVHKTLASSCDSSDTNMLSIQVVHQASISSDTMKSDARKSEATSILSTKLESSVSSPVSKSCKVRVRTEDTSPKTPNRIALQHIQKPPVFPRTSPKVENKDKEKQEQDSVSKSPSPTNIQDFPRRVHDDRPSEHLGAGTRPRLIEPPQDDALSSAGETDVEDPDTAEPKAVLFLVDKQKEVARARSLSISATRQHVTPARDSTWPMTTNRFSVDGETWEIAPASIREVDTQFVDVESRRLSNGSRFSEKDLTFGFFPERLRTDNRKQEQWDSYLPETLMANQFAEMGTRSRARPPSGRRRVRGAWRTREQELDSRPWDGNRPRRAKTEQLHHHDSFYSTDMTEPTTMEIITAIAPVAEEDKPRRRRRIRMRKKRCSKVEQTVAEWMSKPKPIQLPRWPKELRRIQSHVSP